MKLEFLYNWKLNIVVQRECIVAALNRKYECGLWFMLVDESST